MITVTRVNPLLTSRIAPRLSLAFLSVIPEGDLLFRSCSLVARLLVQPLPSLEEHPRKATMESSNNSARRSEDIALDLLKFIAPHASVGRPGASTGFGPP